MMRVMVACMGLSLLGCDGKGGSQGAFADAPPATGAAAVGTDPPALVREGKKCILHLHGKGQRGQATAVDGDVTHVRPDGNAEGWGGKQWLYFPDSGYEQIRTALSSALTAAGCKRVIVHGFSNGAAAAAKLLCRGETFGGTTIGYIVDDPVPDHAVENCKAPEGVKSRLFWTGGLAQATDGWDCKPADWTCEGGSTIGISKYSMSMGVPITQSTHTSHEEYVDPPEETSWW